MLWGTVPLCVYSCGEWLLAFSFVPYFLHVQYAQTCIWHYILPHLEQKLAKRQTLLFPLDILCCTELMSQAWLLNLGEQQGWEGLCSLV